MPWRVHVTINLPLSGRTEPTDHQMCNWRGRSLSHLIAGRGQVPFCRATPILFHSCFPISQARLQSAFLKRKSGNPIFDRGRNARCNPTLNLALQVLKCCVAAMPRAEH